MTKEDALQQYHEDMTRYIRDVLLKKARPLIVTSLVRNIRADDGSLTDEFDLQAHLSEAGRNW